MSVQFMLAIDYTAVYDDAPEFTGVVPPEGRRSLLSASASEKFGMSPGKVEDDAITQTYTESARQRAEDLEIQMHVTNLYAPDCGRPGMAPTLSLKAAFDNARQLRPHIIDPTTLESKVS
jgi:hypothetical protein